MELKGIGCSYRMLREYAALSRCNMTDEERDAYNMAKDALLAAMMTAGIPAEKDEENGLFYRVSDEFMNRINDGDIFNIPAHVKDFINNSNDDERPEPAVPETPDIRKISSKQTAGKDVRKRKSYLTGMPETPSVRKEDLRFMTFSGEINGQQNMFLVYPIGKEYLAALYLDGSRKPETRYTQGHQIRLDDSTITFEESDTGMTARIEKDDTTTNLTAKKPNPGGGHPVITDDGIEVHICPLTTKNRPDGSGMFMYAVITDYTIEGGISMDNAIFKHNGSQYQINASWENTILKARISPVSRGE